MLTRRDMVKLGVLGTGYMLLPHDQPFAPVSSAFAANNFRSPATRPWMAELPVPAEPIPVPPYFDYPADYKKYVDQDTQFFEIVAEQRFVRFHPDLPQTAIWGYRDANPFAPPPSVLGPTFKSRFGPFADLNGKPKIAGGNLVRHRNELPPDARGFGLNSTTVHLHGAHLPARADGFPVNVAAFHDPVVSPPGGFIDHMYPLLDPGFVFDTEGQIARVDSAETPSTLWYHDHLLDFTGPNVYRGLVAFFLLFDDPNSIVSKTALDVDDETDPRGLQLPSGPCDIPIVLQDKRFASDGSLVFNSFDHDGFLGDKYVLNGAIQPYLRVTQRKYRFRFLNGSNARVYQIFLADSSGVKYPMTMIATEGGLLAAPIRNISSFMIAMAERIEVVIDFSGFAAGTELFLENRLQQTEGTQPDGLVSRGRQILKFIVEGPPADPDYSRVPDVLRPFEPISAAELSSAVRRTFVFGDDDGWTINGRPSGQLDRPIATPRQGRGEIWRLVNDGGGWWHPVHIHSDYCRVLRRNGRAPNLYERDGMGKKDTILLKGDDVVEVFVKFRDHLGPFVFHCHNLEHEDMSMMARFDVLPA